MTAHDHRRAHGDTLGRDQSNSVMPLDAPEHRLLGMRRLAAARPEPIAPRPTPTADAATGREQSRIRTLASLENTRRVKAEVMATPCPRCEAPAGHYCFDFRSSGVRGFCGARWPQRPGWLTSSRSAAPAAGGQQVVPSALDERTRPDYRHPNRHPLQHTRG